MASPPSAAALRDLSRKYDTIARLRRDRAEGGMVAERHVLLALAREFPGALRELDTLTEAELARRSEALRAAADTGGAAHWMAWMAAYHATMRAALLVKARVARTGELSEEAAQTLARLASERSGLAIDEGFVRAIAHPPDGRLNRVVFQRLGEEFGEPPEVIWEALFPARRTARY